MPRRPKRNASKTKLQAEEAMEPATPSTPTASVNEIPATEGISRADKLAMMIKMFDDNFMSEKLKILNSCKELWDGNLALPFASALAKVPPSIKEMKWSDYVQQQRNGTLPSDIDMCLTATDRSVRFLVQSTSSLSGASARTNLMTPATTGQRTVACSTAKAMTVAPKFDVTTPAPLVNKRLPKPGEILMSVRGSPVAVPSAALQTDRFGQEPPSTLLRLPGGKAMQILNVPEEADSVEEIPTESLKKMKELHKTLGQMLKKKK